MRTLRHSSQDLDVPTSAATALGSHEQHHLGHTGSQSLGASPANRGTLKPLSALSTARASKQEDHTCPSVLLVSTSMIRHGGLLGGLTFCHPGAQAKEVISAALQLSEQHRSASTMVLEAGINNLRFQQSEVLKQDFTTMIDRLLTTGKQLIIPGLLPPPRYGDIITS